MKFLLKRFSLLYDNVNVQIMQYNSVVTAITNCMRAMSIDRILEKRNFNICMPFYLETLLC